MSGHNKWSKIKRQKGAADAKKSQIFSKYSRAITFAAKQGGGDPDANAALRLAIEKAKSADMPKDNIHRAIQKGLGKIGEHVRFEEVTYEGFGPNGVAFMVKALTDNKNRTVSEIRTVFGKHGGSLGVVGSTAYIFSKDPQNPTFVVDVDTQTVEKLLKLEADLDESEDVQEVYSNYKPA